MNRGKYLANRLREVYLNGTWIANTNYLHQLQQVDWQMALKKIGEHNTIAVLTFHIQYYIDGILEVLNGGPLSIRDVYSFNMPELNSESEWQERIEIFAGKVELLAGRIEVMTDKELESPFVMENYGIWYRNIDGLIEHGYYHLGQISLIRKLISSDSKI